MTSANALVMSSLRPENPRLQTDCKRRSAGAERALERSRRALVERGRVDPYRHGEPLAIGDRVITLTNDHRLGLINGERGLVTGVDPRTGNIDVLFDRRREVTTIPNANVEAGGVDYAYAMTVHKAQGLTCDRAYVLGDEHLHREAGYTALSRGRKENRLYTVDPEPDHETHTGIDSDIVREAVRRAFEQQRSKGLATEWQRRQPGRSTDLDQDIEIDL